MKLDLNLDMDLDLDRGVGGRCELKMVLRVAFEFYLGMGGEEGVKG